MLRYIVIAFAIFLPMFKHLQAQTTQIFKDWATLDGTQNLFIKATTVTDVYQSVYVAGATRNGNGDYDILITKHDKFGNLIWTDTHDGAGGGDDAALALFVDTHCNLFITGTTFTSATDTQDVIVINYDSTGAQSWVSVYSGADHLNDYGTAILMQADTIYIGGVVTDSTDSTNFLFLKYDLSGTLRMETSYDDAGRADLCTGISITGPFVMLSGATQTGVYDWDYLIVKYVTTTGYLMAHWTSGGSTAGFDRVNGACKDNSGNICLTGTAFNGSSGYDIYTVLLDANLSVIWDETYSGTSNHTDVGNAVASDNSGNIYVTGFTDSLGTPSDFVTLKYNNTGAQQWVRLWNGTADSADTARAIVIDNNGNPVITGNTWSGSSDDYHTIKYDASGNLLWEISYNNKYNLTDRPTDIAKDDEGNIIVTGQSEKPDGSWEYATVKYVERAITSVADTDSICGSTRFIENRGQLVDYSEAEVERVLFYSSNGYPKMFCMADTLTYIFDYKDIDTTNNDTVQKVNLVLDGTNEKLLPIERDDVIYNYCIGDISDWRPNVPVYRGFFRNSVWPAIDVNYSINEYGLKTNFIVFPKGDPGDIEMDYYGQDSVTIDTNYNLVIHTGLGRIMYKRPRAWELDDDGTFISLGWQPKYVVSGGHVSFTDIGAYDNRHRLVISQGNGVGTPSAMPAGNVQWSTFIGGAQDDWNLDITRSSAQDIYVGGKSESVHFATNAPGLQPVRPNAGKTDGSVMKFDQNGVLKWYTFIGGSDNDAIQGVTFNEGASTPKLFVAGYLEEASTNFAAVQTNPVFGSYFKTSSSGKMDVFLGRLAETNGLLMYGVYLGGELNDEAKSVTSDVDGNVYITGNTKSTQAQSNTCQATTGNNFPLCDPGNGAYYQATNHGGQDIFLVKLDKDNILKLSTFYGGASHDSVLEINLAIDPNQTLNPGPPTVLICGTTASTGADHGGNVPANGDFPLCDVTGATDYFEGGTGAFISRFSNNGNLIWASNFNNIQEFQTITSSDQNFYAVGLIVPTKTGASGCGPLGNTHYPICNPVNSYTQSSNGQLYIVKLEKNTYELKWSTVYGTSTSWEDVFRQNYNGSVNSYLNTGVVTWSFPHRKFLDAVVSPSTEELYILGTTLTEELCTLDASLSTWYSKTANQGASGYVADAFLLGFNNVHNIVWGTLFGSDNAPPGAGSHYLDHPWDVEFGSALCLQNQELIISGYSGNNHGGSGSVAFPFVNPGFNAHYQTGTNTNASGATWNLDGYVTRFGLNGFPVSISEQPVVNSSFILYPNPTHYSFSIKLPESIHVCKFKVIDLSGRDVISTTDYSAGGEPVNINRLSSGIYFVTVYYNGQAETFKLVSA